MEILFLILAWACKIYSYVVISAVIISWVRARPDNQIIRYINSVTEPIFEHIRKKLPVVISNIDASPLIVLVVLSLLEGFFYSIARFGFSFKLLFAIIVEGIISILGGIILIYLIIVVLYILGPHVNLRPGSQLGIIVRNLVDIVANPIRSFLPGGRGSVDLAPYLLVGLLAAGYFILNLIPRLILGIVN